MTRDEARALIERAVKLSTADEIQVNLSSGDEKNVRFADNRITTSGSATDTTLRVYSAFGRKHAVATSNDVSAEGIERVVRQSEALAPSSSFHSPRSDRKADVSSISSTVEKLRAVVTLERVASMAPAPD